MAPILGFVGEVACILLAILLYITSSPQAHFDRIRICPFSTRTQHQKTAPTAIDWPYQGESTLQVSKKTSLAIEFTRGGLNLFVTTDLPAPTTARGSCSRLCALLFAFVPHHHMLHHHRDSVATLDPFLASSASSGLPSCPSNLAAMHRRQPTRT